MVLRVPARLFSLATLLTVPALIVLAALHAAPPAAHPSLVPATPAQTVTFDAGFMRHLAKPRTIELREGVTFHHQDETLAMSDAVVTQDINLNAVRAVSQSSVHLYDTQNDLTGGHGTIDFAHHLATLQDQIVLVAKPGPKTTGSTAGSLRNRFKDPATLTCALLTYDYKAKVSHIPGTLTITQKDRVLTADSGEYDSKTQIATLMGHVHGHDSDGNLIESATAIMALTDGQETITLPTPIQGVLKIKETGTHTTDTHTVAYEAGSGVWRGSAHQIALSQGVTLHQDDATLKTDRVGIVLDADQNAESAASQSSVHLYDTQNDLTGGHGTIDFVHHLATLQDQIVLVAKPGPKTTGSTAGSLRNRFKDPATLTCALLTYDYKAKVTHIPGTLTVTQKDRELTANAGEYDSNAQIITLTGNVQGHDSDQNHLQGPSAVMIVKEGAESITLRGPIHGTFKVKEAPKP